jgi:Uma2 family endonuclease
VHEPDAAFVSAERLGEGEIPAGFWPVAPELAVEVLSPASTAEGIQEKVLQFLDAGTRTVWVVHPEARTVTVWSPPAEARVVDEDGRLDAGDVVPGFRMEIAELFRR